jgi:glycosyltransferase involved in cell wall biosynthesis
MKILIITDAWEPQINGVVTTLKNTIAFLKNNNHDVCVIHPYLDCFTKISLLSYSEIKIAVNPWRIFRLIEQYNPDAIHISTEGPLGIAARYYCLKHKLKFTTSYHTKFPEYISKKLPLIPISIFYSFEVWFHKKSENVLVTTKSMKRELKKIGFKNNLIVWSRGVDLEIFNPQRKTRTEKSNKPILLYVGRISSEKNIEALLSFTESNYEIRVVGSGPQLKVLMNKYPNVIFLGALKGVELATEYANADVFVFPSKTDTFGVVMIEANACGIPVAAYPVTGPKDFIINGKNGVLHKNLKTAIENCLKLYKTECYNHVKNNYSWDKCSSTFLQSLVLTKE